jgi:hypothetical protein
MALGARVPGLAESLRTVAHLRGSSLGWTANNFDVPSTIIEKMLFRGRCLDLLFVGQVFVNQGKRRQVDLRSVLLS